MYQLILAFLLLFPLEEIIVYRRYGLLDRMCDIKHIDYKMSIIQRIYFLPLVLWSPYPFTPLPLPPLPPVLMSSQYPSLESPPSLLSLSLRTPNL